MKIRYITILLLIFAVYSVLLSNLTREVNIKGPDLITMNSRKIVSSNSISPYKTTDTYVSDIEKVDFKFTSVGISWYEYLPLGTKVEMSVKFLVDDEWTEWIETDEDLDLFQDDPDSVRKYALALTNPANAVQYKFTLFGDGKNSPFIKSIDSHFIKSGKMMSIPKLIKGKYASSNSNSTLSNLSNPVGIIDRETWGANESYRYLSNNFVEPILVDLGDDFYEKFSDELTIDRIVEHDENGDKYKWPLQYPEEIKKIIVHHTASTKNLDDPMQAMRDVYYYHAISRGWGDIGYNYIIDTAGNIYEGRFGGEGVIAAHSGPANHGSIGIAVLGNYQSDQVPEAVTNSLNKLINLKSKIHGFNPAGKSTFRHEHSHNILGHSDVMQTSCPGENLYEKLPVIRTVSAQMSEEKEKFIKDYDFQNQSDIYYLELKPEEEKTITLEYENIGTENWDSSTYITIYEDKNILDLPTKVKIGNSTKSSEIGRFQFTIKAADTSGTEFLEIKLDQVDDPFVLPVKVQETIFDYQIEDVDLGPEKIKIGDEEKIKIEILNTGNVTWKNLVLLSDKNIEIPMNENAVKPGETANFSFKLQSPKSPQIYNETFTPYLENVIWNNPQQFEIETLFYERGYELKLLESMTNKTFRQNKSYTVSLNFINIGDKEINKEKIKAHLLRHEDINVKDLRVSKETIESSESFIISFNVSLDDNAKLAKRSLIFMPKLNETKLLRKPITVNYSVLEKLNIPVSTENNIRIKLSFKGEPEITANTAFKVYVDGEFYEELTNLSSVKVEDDLLELNNREVGYKQSVRFESDGILEIQNYDNRPAWNKSLNDNVFRGVLEVIKDDGELVVINELDLEDYLKGLGEVLNADPTEKIKALMVAARTYAKYYMEIDEKFPGKDYHLDDDPNVSQKYLGYGFELRAPNIAAAVNSTAGEVVTYNGEIVKTPYFSSSDGFATKSAKEVWGWDFTPYLKSVSDTYCSGTYFYGHGVGLSGCGSKGMADAGYDYEEILKHYYTGIEIEDLY